jgi:copper homeostasis protein
MKDGGLVIEALCGSAEDALSAADAGADRIELNSSLASGGLTPSVGSLRLAKARCGLPIVAMLRPRPAGFCYSGLELEVMREDGEALLGAGADGLVFGLLTEEGRVDLVRAAGLMRALPCPEWVFNRAFDLVPDPFRALEELVDLGVRRVLTKGQANSFEEGEALLLELRERAAGRIEILVPGVRPYNVRHIVAVDGFDQIHVGTTRPRADPSNAARPGIYFGARGGGDASAEGCYPAFDPDYFRQIAALVRA